MLSNDEVDEIREYIKEVEQSLMKIRNLLSKEMGRRNAPPVQLFNDGMQNWGNVKIESKQLPPNVVSVNTNITGYKPSDYTFPYWPTLENNRPPSEPTD